jgi:hypothetical protein
MISMEILWFQAILNINDISVVILVHTQWPTELPALYKIYSYFEPVCVDSIISVLYIADLNSRVHIIALGHNFTEVVYMNIYVPVSNSL